MAKEIEKPDQIFEDVLAAAASMPGVRIDREAFLRRSLGRYCDDSTIEIAVEQNPAAAKVPSKTIMRIANESINYETSKVTAISTAAGIPGGFAMLGTIPADAAQYFAHVLRISQKLAYLYSWPSLFDENSEMDDATKSLLTLFIGIMFGAQAAGDAVVKVANRLAANLVKQLPKKALTKGFIYPIVKKVAAYLGVQMTKGVFAKGVGKIVPIVGGVVSGAITLASFRPMSAKLRDYLAKLPLANPEMYQNGANATATREDAGLTIEAEAVEIVNLPQADEVTPNDIFDNVD
ncbi:hypothetical protein [Xiamenia xianingshaonis]|uniref:hypothetical protein n=1 Tax=Xiamenia xianingshaonis TaxID=2682776 RepID=UPI0021BD94CE|nr:hypothetical protein [Xiamenia xianingshaonis]